MEGRQRQCLAYGEHNVLTDDKESLTVVSRPLGRALIANRCNPPRARSLR
jgi:hypothetical protein